MRMKDRLLMLAAASAAMTIGCGSLGTALRVTTGLVSHNLCSEVFVSGRDPDVAYAEVMRPRQGLGLVDPWLAYAVDRERSEVVATLQGRFEARSVYRPKLGCRLDPAGAGPLPELGSFPILERTERLLPDVADTGIVVPSDPDLLTALDRAFAEPEGHLRQTRAVVVVHKGKIIAERYAPGFDIDTPLLGYSATKSVLSALIGILVRKELVAVHGPAPVAAWTHADDPRHAISIDHLLRMTSGLSLAENGSPWSPVAQMLYGAKDMGGFAETAALQEAPGTRWRYTSGNALILSRILRDAVGGTRDDVLRFAHRELFQPLGMRDVILELDAVGTPIGSTYMLAPARDWARFGLLYLDDGRIGGKRILPAGWVGYTHQPTLDTGYGAGFWTQHIAGEIPWSAASWGIPGAPQDAFFARGLLGQYVVIVPSQELVLVRMGSAHGPDGDMEGISRLLEDVTNALQ